MKLTRCDQIPYYQFSHLLEFSEIIHGVFTRHGGLSSGAFASLNVSFGVGDDNETIRRNRGLLYECLNSREIVFVNQVHGTYGILLRDGEPTLNAAGDNRLTGDALITNIPGKALAIQVADCQAILLYDPVRKIVANIHSGWRGSIANIAGSTIHMMVSHFGTEPSNLMAGIGPSLGPCCAEFVNYRSEIPKEFWEFKNNKHHFDFWKITEMQLRTSGLPKENIQNSQLCTQCRTDLFFSYRGEKITGRFGVAIGLKG